MLHIHTTAKYKKDSRVNKNLNCNGVEDGLFSQHVTNVGKVFQILKHVSNNKAVMKSNDTFIHEATQQGLKLDCIYRTNHKNAISFKFISHFKPHSSLAITLPSHSSIVARYRRTARSCLCLLTGQQRPLITFLQVHAFLSSS